MSNAKGSKVMKRSNKNSGVQKLVVIGLDGATWNVILPLVRENRLLTFRKLMENGVHGVLKSTIPPVTGASWVSFSSGKNPGKTGIFDFLIRMNGEYVLRPLNSSDFRGIAFWDLLSNNRIKVGIFNFPMLYPPYKVNGFMISGVGASKHDNITYPPQLQREIEDVAGGYEIIVRYHDKKYDDVDLFLKDVSRVLDKQVKVMLYLMQKKEWNVFIAVISCTDWIQHLMWKYYDENHPLYDEEEAKRYKSKFIDFWVKIDNIMEKVIKTAGRNTNLFVVSDHGFGPQCGCFNLAKWLEIKGYLKIHKPKTLKLKRGLRLLLSGLRKTFLRKILTQKLRRKVRASFIDITAEIDFSNSRAYVLGHTIPFGAIYLNVKGRDSKGIVNKGPEYEALKNEIITLLTNLGKDIGINIRVNVFDPQKTYRGKYTDVAPDIIFTINNWECVILNDFHADFLYKNEPYSNRHTGSHRMEGIFLAYGPDIKKGVEIKNLQIYDIAPTILYMFDIPIPSDIDGKILKEMFKEESKLAKKKVKYEKICKKEKIKRKIKELKLKNKL